MLKYISYLAQRCPRCRSCPETRDSLSRICVTFQHKHTINVQHTTFNINIQSYNDMQCLVSVLSYLQHLLIYLVLLTTGPQPPTPPVELLALPRLVPYGLHAEVLYEVVVALHPSLSSPLWVFL